MLDKSHRPYRLPRDIEELKITIATEKAHSSDKVVLKIAENLLKHLQDGLGHETSNFLILRDI